METIATDAVLLVQFVGDGIHISLWRHRLVESCVEHAHVRQARHQLLHGIHALQVGRVVQRRQVRALFEGFQHLVGQEHALVELLAAMHHAVTYGINLVKTLDDTNLGVGQQREDELHALGVLRYVVHNLTLLAIGELHLYKGTVQAYTLGTATGHHTLVVHVVQCVLDGGRTTIQY